MAYYLVRAKPVQARLQALKEMLDSGRISKMRPFGGALNHSLLDARLDREGWAIWEEEDYCTPPLKQERAAVLDEHFTDLSVKPVEEGAGWKEVEGLPRLWEQGDSL